VRLLFSKVLNIINFFFWASPGVSKEKKWCHKSPPALSQKKKKTHNFDRLAKFPNSVGIGPPKKLLFNELKGEKKNCRVEGMTESGGMESGGVELREQSEGAERRSRAKEQSEGAERKSRRP
jgi:hypothetical protein